MYNSVKIHKLSPSQERKLKKGQKVIIKMGGEYDIKLNEEQTKKLNKAHQKGKGLTIQLDPYQQMEMSGKEMVCSKCGEMQGEGFKDFVGKVKRAGIGKKIIKFAKDTKLAKRVGDALIERAVKTIAGSGRPRGRPRKNGGALFPAGYDGGAFPAGGGALMPAGY
jgi:hypothetical protein